MFLLDTTELANVCKEWGIGDSDMFASMQLMRPFSRTTAAHTAQPSPEQVRAMQDAAKARVRSLLHDTKLIPQELVFVGRCMNIIRANNKELGSPVNRVKILGEQALQANVNQMSFLQRVAFNVQLSLVSVTYYLSQLWATANRWVGRKSADFEEILEIQMKDSLTGHHHGTPQTTTTTTTTTTATASSSS
jgi:aarF domain-containing kinase